MSEILLTHRTFDVLNSMLENAGHNVNVITEGGGRLSKKELINGVVKKEYEAISTLLTDVIDKEVIDSFPKSLKIIANYAVGFDNIDVEYAKEKGIVVTNTPDVLTNAVAEHTIALIISSAKRIVEEDRFVRSGSYKGWEPKLYIGKELKGKTIGILGLGRIGYRVAEIARKGFDMNVVYFDLKQNTELEENLGAQFSKDVETLFKVSDFITVHLPLTEKTRGLVDESKFKLMKKDSILVNTSRGPIVKEKDLSGALKSGRIFYSGIDVFENEPEVYEGLKSADNIIMTPHTASATQKTRKEMAKLVAQNILAVLDGEPPLTAV